MRRSFAAIVRSATIVAGLSATSLGFGFAKDLLVAARFGVRDSTDAYFGAIAMPRVLNSVTLSLVGLVVVSVFVDIRERRGAPAAWRYAEHIVASAALIAVALATLSSVFATPLVHVTLPGFAEEHAVDTTQLLLMLTPAVALVGLTAVLGGLLNANQVFALPALLGVAVNVAIIGFIVSAAGSLDIAALALGTDVGYGVFALLELAMLMRLGLRLRPRIDIADRDVLRTATLVLPLVAAVAVEQAALLGERLFASFGGTGGVSLYVFITKLRNVPITLIGQALGVALYPSLAQAVASGKRPTIRAGIGKGVQLAFALSVPLGLAFLVSGEPIVRLVYERGSFTAADSAEGGVLLAAFAVGVVALTIIEVLERAFYSLQDTRLPAVASVARAVSQVVAAIVLTPLLGVVGVAVAFSIGALVECGTLGIVLARRLEGRFRAEATQIAAAACVTFVTLRVGWLPLTGLPDLGGVALGLAVAGLGLVGFAAYAATIVALGGGSVRGTVAKLFASGD